ncbi:cation diffusion facilitator family transporter [Halomarina halobia]|uniref:Cation diffusion facilitator family transporter n=1 Tax=Halomarina halobia TaxID=3033386 RepID=A0ABD6A7Q0_9EURY|nr:cation diffusion facilitator family transporter [Halomarina sp. PSR21]
MDRVAALRRVGLVILGVNLLLALAKGGVYLSTGSIAVGSEAVNSLADAAYSLIVVGGLYLTTQPPDEVHPHGHERIEPFVSLFVALGVFAAGGVVLWQAIEAVLAGGAGGHDGPLAAGVLAVGAGAKYLLYRYCIRVAAEYNSPALEATALDNRADILTAGAALAGVLGAALGAPVLDPLAGAVVALGVLYAGVEIVRDNVNYLVGAAPSEELQAEIVGRALSHPEVEGVHDVVAHYVGPEVDVSLHIEIEGDRTVAEAHDIETDVATAIRDIDAIDDVFVHLDPRELGEWKDECEESGERVDLDGSTDA